jgi:DNA repair protein RecO (recombination protein O)
MTGARHSSAMVNRDTALVCAARPHGEVGVILRALTPGHGLVAAYVSGGRGREMRPVLIPGNSVSMEWRANGPNQLPGARVEMMASRAPFLSEPLLAAAIQWVTGLVAVALPERHPYPALHSALEALLTAVCHAPSARGWVPGMVAFEALVLRELGYGDRMPDPAGDWDAILRQFDATGALLARYVLAERRGDVMGAREVLRARLGRISGARDGEGWTT